MHEKSLGYAAYWRNSLADAALGHGALSADDVKGFQPIPLENLSTGVVDKTIVDACFAGEPESVQAVDVMLRPKVYLGVSEHAQRRDDGIPEIVAPLVTPAKLTRDGRLVPGTDTLIARDLLEPLERGAYTIGSVARLDAYLGANRVTGHNEAEPEDDPDAQWQRYTDDCARMLAEVCTGWPGDSQSLVAATFGYLVKKSSASRAGAHILALYDHLRRTRPTAPLFDRYADERIDAPEPDLPPQSAFSTRLGHASDVFPLTPAQRDALTHLLAARDGEIVATNGPPGTGKTTLLLSIVASLWARAALDGKEPPVILAASTNNQAVTNIIDAFGKDFSTGRGAFAGRWLPDVTSFGAYFPSRKKETEATGKYLTRSFFNRVETADNFHHAQVSYLDKARCALPDLAEPTVEAVVDRLQALLRAQADQLAAIESAWTTLADARAAVQRELGADPGTKQQQRIARLRLLEENDHRASALATQWEGHLARESILYALFAWLPPVAAKRLLLARVFLRQAWPESIPHDDWRRFDQIEPAIRSLRERCARELREGRGDAERGARSLQNEHTQSAQWRAATASVQAADGSTPVDLAAADALADTHTRFLIFLLATHYWEGRWLLDLRALLPNLDKEKKATGPSTSEKRWRRRMKLTPCIVSTFYMLPSEMKVSRPDGKQFAEAYLYDFADLLIVDEAGQASPEVAGASFSIAKKALVIGDTQQIEPIASIPRPVDIGNLTAAGLLGGDDRDAAYARVSNTGKAVAGGSVMRIAQCASRYHPISELDRGLFLLEHRRCFDEIIAYCNALCYQGKLIPKRGAKADAGSGDGLPATGYLHIDGLCGSAAGGSRENLLEAEVIAAWLASRRDALEHQYGRRLEDIVGVVTPFGAQVRAITAACRKAGIAAGSQANEMTVGTVHSLQGAERAVVIFSAVYSKHADGGFIDRSPSMLNVAASRAKNSFLVFGDMDVLQLAPPDSPRGRLAAWLLRDDGNELAFEYRRRADLSSPEIDIAQLRDAPEHDAFLTELLARATREVHIVTPWIRLACVEETGAMSAMAAAVGRGVKVHVYTDYGSNIGDRDTGARERKRGELRHAIDALQAHGIEGNAVWKVHSKVVIGDDDVYCVGSFNWFSARRDDRARHETSLVYRGPALAEEKKVMKDSLRQRIAAHRPAAG